MILLLRSLLSMENCSSQVILKIWCGIATQRTKATGPDQTTYPPNYLNTCRRTNTHIHTSLPSQTRNNSNRLVPIFKKGDRLQPINYRPLSLASITCKMLEHIITSNIMQHLDAHNILHDAQTDLETALNRNTAYPTHRQSCTQYR